MLISQQKITPDITDFGSIFKKQDKNIIKRYVPHQYLYWIGSGREALTQILLNIGRKKNIGQKELGIKVGIPAYTCHVVLEAVKRAGCQPVFYDSGVIATVSEIKKVIQKVDVLLLCYNFGFLPEIDKIVDLCRQNKVILVEDCAQALGATYKGKLAGSFGNYAFYSFGISKNIGFCGGMIASNELLELKKMNLKNLKPFPKRKLVKISGEVLISALFFNKTIYPLARKFLKKELIKKQEDLDYYLPKFAMKIILNQFKRYDFISKMRRKNAEFCCKELKSSCKELGHFNFVEPAEKSVPSWLYFAILSGNLSSNNHLLINKLLKEKVEVGEMVTFKCLDGKSKLALKAEKEVLTFALYRPFEEVKFMVNKIKKVLSKES